MIEPHDRSKLYEGALEKYLARLPAIKETARLHGYAIAIHGSMIRDFDLVAIPWAVDCSDLEPLLRDIVIASEGVLQEGSPSNKPFGIKSANIMIGGHLYIDLKIIPKRRDDA